MNVGKATAFRSWKYCIGLVTTLIFSSSLSACSERGGEADSNINESVPEENDEAATRYREKVKQRVSASVVRSYARELGVSQAKVECLLDDLDVFQLEDVNSDDTVAAVFDECGVDPAVVD